MSQFSTYVGLDVHKKSIVLAFASEGSRETPSSLGSVPNDYTRLKAKLLKLGTPRTIKKKIRNVRELKTTQAPRGPIRGRDCWPCRIRLLGCLNLASHRSYLLAQSGQTVYHRF